MLLKLAPQAEAELDHIWNYIAQKSGSFEIADHLIDSIEAALLLLSRHPYVGRRRDQELRPGLRSFPVKNYVIIYRVDGDCVLILHILRGNRHVEALLG